MFAYNVAILFVWVFKKHNLHNTAPMVSLPCGYKVHLQRPLVHLQCSTRSALFCGLFDVHLAVQCLGRSDTSGQLGGGSNHIDTQFKNMKNKGSKVHIYIAKEVNCCCLDSHRFSLLYAPLLQRFNMAGFISNVYRICPVCLYKHVFVYFVFQVINMLISISCQLFIF